MRSTNHTLSGWVCRWYILQYLCIISLKLFCIPERKPAIGSSKRFQLWIFAQLSICICVSLQPGAYEHHRWFISSWFNYKTSSECSNHGTLRPGEVNQAKGMGKGETQLGKQWWMGLKGWGVCVLVETRGELKCFIHYFWSYVRWQTASH